MHFRICTVVTLLLLSLLVGCNRSEDPEGLTPLPALTPIIPTPAATPTVNGTPQVTEPAGPPTPIRLNVWVIPELAPDRETAAGQSLADQFASFSASHPNINLNVEVKVSTGQASILSYLRTGRTVAPTIMPDLIVLPVDQLPLAASEQLIFPLDDLVAETDWSDLFPAALSMASHNEARVGYPFTLNNLYHMAYDGATITSTVPITWDGFLSVDNARMVVPGSGVEGAELLLEYYLAAGGMLTGESNQPALQVEPLTAALALFQRGRTQGRILVQSSNHTSIDSTWSAFESQVANIIQTSAAQYLLRVPPDGNTVLAAPFPGYDSAVSPLVRGWAWAISTSDPTEKAVAGELLNWLIASPNLGEWSWHKRVVPAKRSAFESWAGNDAYTTFLQFESEKARAFPAGANNTIMSALSTALFEVLTLSQSPQAAAQAAADSLGS
jgi:ABC-type glycerol-3-phosphate transport system substrate-binding protein